MKRCSRCYRVMDDNYTKKCCEKCLEYSRKKNRENYYNRKERGLCYMCGCALKDDEHSVCRVCKIKNRMSKKDSYYRRKAGKLNELHNSGSAPVSTNQEVV